MQTNQLDDQEHKIEDILKVAIYEKEKTFQKLLLLKPMTFIAQIMKFSIKHFFSKCELFIAVIKTEMEVKTSASTSKTNKEEDDDDDNDDDKLFLWYG